MNNVQWNVLLLSAPVCTPFHESVQTLTDIKQESSEQHNDVLFQECKRTHEMN